jgi:predicted Abi (CAAX) family protease
MRGQFVSEDSRPAGTPNPVLAEVFSGLKRLPDFRAAVEGLILFLVVVAAGIWAAQTGVLELRPVSRDQVFAISLSAFLIPVMGEELAFRGWLRKGAPIGAVISLLAYIAWHPLQTILQLPFGRPEFLDPRFLGLIAWLGLACTLSRIRSGSIWPAVIIHWGVVVVWKALYGG